MHGDAMPAVADPAIVAVELDGKLSLYRPATQLVLTLNESASVIWLEIEDGTHRTVGELAGELADRLGVERDVMARDVGDALSQLQAAGFVRLDGAERSV